MRYMWLFSLFHFYRSFAALFTITDLLCWWIYFNEGNGVIVALVFIKIVTGGAAAFVYSIQQHYQFYYYYNQHIPKWMLWLSCFAIDAFIFIGGLCLLNWAR